MNGNITTELTDNIEYFNKILDVEKSFDLIYRVIKIGDKKACFYCIDGFVKDDIMEKILEFLFSIEAKDMPKNAHELSKGFTPYVEVDITNEKQKIITNILSGVVVLFVDGYESCVLIDCRTYPARSVSEPDKDKVQRGSRDGFVETVVMNTALIRRRIRDPKLTIEMTNLGTISHTDIAICYMEGMVDENFLLDLKDRIKHVDVKALTMNQESLAECLYRRKWYNPFPKFKYSERPDTAAASIIDGNIVMLVDNSPSAIIMPTSLFDIIEEADDFYFPPITGTYLRWSRFIITFVSLILTPTFLLLMQNPQWIPKSLEFIKIKEAVNIPIIIQLLILEFSIDGLKLAALNTPSMLSTPLSVMAALVLGEFTVKSGWFNAETMLYMAFVAIASYTQASYELSYALKFMRVITLVLTALFNLPGYIIGYVISFIMIVSNKTVSGKSYLYPLIPFDAKALKRKLLRVRLPHSTK